MKAIQHEMPVVGDAFNLAPEKGIDIDRQLRDERVQLARECSAREYAAKMQRQLAECPGFVGADIAPSEQSASRLMLDPRLVLDAVGWLKRRFRVSDALELHSTGNALCVEIAPRRRGQTGKRQVRFGKVEQFKFEGL